MNWPIPWRRLLLPLLIIALSLFVAVQSWANAAAPPLLCWLKFDPALNLQSLQLGQCPGDNCQRAILIKQYGTCDRQGCLSGPTQPGSLNVECAENLCLVSRLIFAQTKGFDPTKIQVRAQIGDQVLVSKKFSLDNDRPDEPLKFKVQTLGSSLEFTPDGKMSVARSRVVSSLFQVAFFLTIIIEAAIWAGFLRWQQRSNEIKPTIFALIAAEAFSLPIIWSFVLGLQHFATVSEQYSGWVWLICALTYGMVLSLYSLRKQPMNWQTIQMGSVAYWLGSGSLTLIVGGIMDYGSPSPSMAGLSYLNSLVIGEAIVICYEAVLIQRLRREQWKLTTALGVSTIANGISCLAGLIFS
jgi:hypothetical protein